MEATSAIQYMLNTLHHFLSLIRFSHTVFALPFALLAAVMAWWLRAVEKVWALKADPVLSQTTYIFGNGFTFVVGDWGSFDSGFESGYMSFTDKLSAIVSVIRWQELLGILLCMVFARSAAMAFNRVVDSKIDAENPRTATRHIPAGVLSASSVWLFVAITSIGFVASTLLFWPNKLPLYLSVPLLAFLCGYSYAKRFTSFAHFWLGAALAMSPIAAWIALRGEQVIANGWDLLPAIVLGGAVLTWVSGFDIIYACQDHQFDSEAKLHSVPTWLGIRGALRLAAACHFVTALLLACLALVYPPLGPIYLGAVVLVSLLLVYEHWIVSPNDLGRVNIAFFNVNAVISLGLLAVGIADLLI